MSKVNEGAVKDVSKEEEDIDPFSGIRIKMEDCNF